MGSIADPRTLKARGSEAAVTFAVEEGPSPLCERAAAPRHAPGRVCDIPSLDGLRAVSILLVMIGHCSGTRGFPSGLPGLVTDHGRLGVQIFFVISGFLITSLLLREKQNVGRISLKLFYARRTLRIFPAFYLFLLTTLVLYLVGMVDLPRHNLVYAATYTMNYVDKATWWTGHLWSLSVEEQFYLLWPALICLIGTRAAVWAAASVAIGSPVALSALHFLHLPRFSGVLWFPFDSIAAGCALAYVLPHLRRQGWLLKATSSRLGLVVPLAMLLADGQQAHPRVFWLLGLPFLNLGIAYCIARFTAFHTDAVGRLLNCRVMVFVGGLSYSLYLWQEPFLNRYVANALTAFPLNCCCALGLACISYFVVERPFLRLRKRFQPAFRHGVLVRAA
jgi:peptidoglycan/LPS O-acetylase OafA/YrhL